MTTSAGTVSDSRLANERVVVPCVVRAMLTLLFPLTREVTSMLVQEPFLMLPDEPTGVGDMGGAFAYVIVRSIQSELATPWAAYPAEEDEAA